MATENVSRRDHLLMIAEDELDAWGRPDDHRGLDTVVVDAMVRVDAEYAPLLYACQWLERELQDNGSTSPIPAAVVDQYRRVMAAREES